MDIEQRRREAARWAILRILDAGRPVGVNNSVSMSVLAAEKLVISRRDLQRECDYLHKLGLIMLDDGDDEMEGFAKLTAAGIDVVEYTAPAPTGIARPAKGAR